MHKVSFSQPAEHTAYIGAGAVALLKDAVEKTACGVCAVVADSGVPGAHVGRALAAVEAAGAEAKLCTFPAGERSKTLAGVEGIYRFLYENGFKRSDLIIAVGGGVPGDMAGYAAATYLRGLGFINVPTTVIAQTDSAYGGKTGVDYLEGKNHIGCFYAPKAVICDTSFLNTLPEKERLCGMGEVIKYGVIADAELLERAAANGGALPDEETIVRCALIKKRFVEGDAYDKGARRTLNFGHTFGHAIEAASGYTVPHGQAVVYGMLAAAHIGCGLGITKCSVGPRIAAAAEAVGLDTGWRSYAEAALPLVSRDKKAGESGIDFVLPEDIAAPVRKRLTPEEIAGLI